MNKEIQIYIHDEKKNNKQYSDTNDIHNKNNTKDNKSIQALLRIILFELIIKYLKNRKTIYSQFHKKDNNNNIALREKNEFHE